MRRGGVLDDIVGHGRNRSWAEWWPLERVLTEFRPGSHYTRGNTGEPWTWEDERKVLLYSPEHNKRTLGLANDLSYRPMHDPICLGTDGRVWDGHHRIIAAQYLGLDYVLVEPPYPPSRFRRFLRWVRRKK